ncbi:MAG TPA: hypothetical protein VJ757_01695 [Pseudonocardiaceae bacterium]|nr:hypothetical protein [Pseudonocardiaceae bacterium]
MHDYPDKAGSGGLVEGEPVAANPEAGGARYALHGVMRALLRAVVISGLVAVGWLLGSGLSHADEDPGWPGVGQIHLVDAGSDADPGAGIVGRPTTGSIVDRVLSDAPAPRLAAPPIKKIGILRPVVHAVGSLKPVTAVLTPLPRTLSAPAPHSAAVRTTAAPAATVAPMSPPAPAITPPVAAPASALTPVRHVAPAAVLPPKTVAAAQSAPTQPPLGAAPVDPAPPSPLGTTSSMCIIGTTSGGPSTKNASDFALHDSGATGNLAQSDDPLLLSGSDLPRSLAVKPSTSPD